MEETCWMRSGLARSNDFNSPFAWTDLQGLFMLIFHSEKQDLRFYSKLYIQILAWRTLVPWAHAQITTCWLQVSHSPRMRHRATYREDFRLILPVNQVLCSSAASFCFEQTEGVSRFVLKCENATPLAAGGQWWETCLLSSFFFMFFFKLNNILIN